MTNETNDSGKRKKRSLLTLLGVLTGFVFFILIVALVFPTPILRFVFSRMEAQSGIVFTFDRAYFYLQEGSFLAIDGLTVKRHNHPASNFEMRAENVRMPAMVSGDFYSPQLLISGLRGFYEIIGTDGNSATEDMFVNTVMLLNAEVELVDRTLDKPFRIIIQLEEFYAVNTGHPSLLSPYTCSGFGQISVANFGIDYSTDHTRKIEIAGLPLGLLASYAPVLDDLFDAGSVNLIIDDLTDETHKRMRVRITLLPDCEIKSADTILAPAIQSALQTLDQSSLSGLRDLKGKTERVKTFAESLRSELDGLFRIIDALKSLAPRDVREKYENFKSRYDRAQAAYEEGTALFQDLDRLKAGIVEETFQRLIASGIPIEMEVQEVNGAWQFDAYETVARLIEKNYQTVIAAEYQKRIQDLHDVIDRLLVL
jgi:hypothetical protein